MDEKEEYTRDRDWFTQLAARLAWILSVPLQEDTYWYFCPVDGQHYAKLVIEHARERHKKEF